MYEDICIYDNVVSIETQNAVEAALTDARFPWYLSACNNHHTVDQYDNGLLKQSNLKIQEYMQFVHVFLKDGQINSPQFNIVDKAFEEFVLNSALPIDGFYRVKANLQTRCSSFNPEYYNTPHIDDGKDHMVAIYYVNDSDGSTVIFDNVEGNYEIIKTIEPKKGRIVIFNGKYYHAGKHPITSDKRIIVNFNFI